MAKKKTIRDELLELSANNRSFYDRATPEQRKLLDEIKDECLKDKTLSRTAGMKLAHKYGIEVKRTAFLNWMAQ